MKLRKPVNGFVMQKYLFVIVLLALPLLNWFMFWLVVNISTIGLAFRDYRTEEFTWANFQEFWRLLSTPGAAGLLGRALENTLKYFIVGLVIGIPGSLFIAFFIYKKIFLNKAFTIIFYLPAIISSVVLVNVYKEFLAPEGIVSKFLKLFNVDIPVAGLLRSRDTACNAIIAYTVWTGFCTNMLLFNGAMSRIPLEILEAAKLDGIKPFRECMQVIFPLIWPTFSTMLILAMTCIFTVSGPILLFDQNNVYNTETISYWIFHMIYGSGNGGTAPDRYNLVSATGLIFTAVGVPVVLFVHWLVEKVPDVEY